MAFRDLAFFCGGALSATCVIALSRRISEMFGINIFKAAAVAIKDAPKGEVEFKLVLAVRQDLGMQKGKIAAQCGHATLGAYKQAQKKTPSALARWETYGQAKIVVKLKDEEDMRRVRARALEDGVLCHTVHDAGRTQIAAGSATVLAIGPASVSAVNKVTGDLKLM